MNLINITLLYLLLILICGQSGSHGDKEENSNSHHYRNANNTTWGNYSDAVLSVMEPAWINGLTDILKLSLKTAEVNVVSIDRLTKKTRRNLVVRVFLDLPVEKKSMSVIFKQSQKSSDTKSDDEIYARFAREWVGLAFMSDIPEKKDNVPIFYGGNKEHRFIVLEDMGANHSDLSIVLYNRNIGADGAEKELKRFMARLGRFHADSYTSMEAYDTLLHQINPKAENWWSKFVFNYESISVSVNETLRMLRYQPSSSEAHVAFYKELHDVTRAGYAPGPFGTVIHGDMCLDNMIENTETHHVYVFDFEWADGCRNALLDATKLRMGMPGCYRRGTLPSKTLDEIEDVYRNELRRTMPAANDDEAYHTALVNACGYRVLKAFESIESVLDENDLEHVKSSTLAKIMTRLLAFIEVSEKYDKLPRLAEISLHIAKEFLRLWPDKSRPLQLYPAFRYSFPRKIGSGKGASGGRGSSGHGH